MLVAECTGRLSRYVRPELRLSLLVSILEQLLSAPESDVRLAATQNFALLLFQDTNFESYTVAISLLF